MSFVDSEKNMIKDYTWYCAVNFLVIPVSAMYTFSMELSGEILSCKPETTWTESLDSATLSFPTLISFEPYTRLVIGDST